MKLIQLQYFNTVVEYNSIAKAAKVLYLSPAALSLAIKELEDEFKTKLFTRNNNILTITEEGKYLASISKSLLSHALRVKNEMNAYVRRKEILKIGIPPMLGSFLIPKILEEFEQTHPAIEIDVVELGSKENQEKVSNNEIDLALTVIRDNKISSKLNYIKIDETELLFAINKNNPLANLNEIDYKDFGNTNLILMKEDTLQSYILNEEFEKRDLTPNIKIRSNQLFTIRELIEHNNYGAFIFNKVSFNDESIKFIPFKEKLFFDIVVAWNKKGNIGEVASNFIKYLEDKYK